MNNNYVKLSFTFKHRNDWTRQLKGIKAFITSVRWVRLIDDNANLEVVLARWLDRSIDVYGFFDKMVKLGKIYEVLSIRELYKNIFLIAFIGPYLNTVRYGIVNNNVIFYDSLIHDGVQEWTMVVSGNYQGLLRYLNNIGRVNALNEEPIGSRSLVEMLLKNGDVGKYVNLALTMGELSALTDVWRNGYFKISDKVKLNNLSKIVGKDKSTLSRQIRSALSKLIPIVYIDLYDMVKHKKLDEV